MSNIGWPVIPEIPVVFKLVDGEMVAHVIADLGILGEWEVGEVKASESDFEEFTPEELEDIKGEIQVAFNRLMMRVATSALIKQGKGCFPAIIWYATALEEEHGAEKANEMIEKDLRDLLQCRENGVGFHEL
jgi:hypothetical protein